jgi:hypothetical protein
MEIGAALSTLTSVTNSSSKGFETLNKKLKTFPVLLTVIESPLTRSQKNMAALKIASQEYSAANDTVYKQLGLMKKTTEQFSGGLGKTIAKLKQSREFVAGLGEQYPQLGKALESVGVDMNKLSNLGESVLAVQDKLIGSLQSLKSAAGIFSDGLARAKKTVAFFRLENINAKIAMVKFQFAAIRTAVVTKTLAVGQGIKTFGKSLLTFARTAIPAAVTGLRVLTLAIVTNPIGAIVTVIGVAVAGLALLIYKYWQPIKAFVSGVWQGFTSALSPVVESLQPLINLLSPIGELFSWVGDAVSWVVGAFNDLLTPVQLGAEQLSEFSSVGQTVGKVLGTVFKALFAPISLVIKGIGLLGDLWNNFFGSDAEDQKQLAISTSKINELTTSVSNAPSLEQANALAAVQGDSTQVQQTNNNQIVINASPDMDKKKLAEEIARELKYQQAVDMRAALNDGAL